MDSITSLRWRVAALEAWKKRVEDAESALSGKTDDLMGNVERAFKAVHVPKESFLKENEWCEVCGERDPRRMMMVPRIGVDYMRSVEDTMLICKKCFKDQGMALGPAILPLGAQ